MCGIAGIMMKGGRPLDPAVLGRLQAALLHRGPDAAGRFVRDGLALVSTRLAVVDPAGGDQPLRAADGAAMVGNGEIYNAPELRAALPGFPFRCLSDMEPVLPLLARDGAGFAASLRGMYAIAAAAPDGTLHLARDPFGIKPLYLAETAECLAFASEPQALRAAGFSAAGPDAERRAELLQLKHCTGAETIFPGIERVAAGETLTLRDGQVVARRNIPAIAAVDAAPPDRAAAVRRFEAVMLDAVAVHLRMDTPWRLFLSGGVDSAILLGLAQRVTGERIAALTIGYPGAGTGDESAAAQRLAERAGATCRRVEMTEADFWAFAPRIAAALDDPTADPAVLPTWMLARAATEEGAKVALTGEGADEIFGGYSRYRRALLPALLRRRGERRGVFTRSGLPLARFNGWTEGVDALEAAFIRQGRSRVDTLQRIDVAERLPNSLLIKLDRCLMAHGVEGRTPFLDREVIGFAFGLPDRLRVGLSFGKLVLREWLARTNPEARPFARKRGFGVPVGAWMHARREALARLVAAQPGVAELFRPEEAGAVMMAAAEEDQPAWSLLFYALWHSRHVLGVDPAGDVAEVLSQAARRG